MQSTRIMWAYVARDGASAEYEKHKGWVTLAATGMCRVHRKSRLRPRLRGVWGTSGDIPVPTEYDEHGSITVTDPTGVPTNTEYDKVGRVPEPITTMIKPNLYTV